MPGSALGPGADAVAEILIETLRPSVLMRKGHQLIQFYPAVCQLQLGRPFSRRHTRAVGPLPEALRAVSVFPPLHSDGISPSFVLRQA